MCQRRPADPTDPGDAADLSIMGYLRTVGRIHGAVLHLVSEHSRKKVEKSILS